MEQGKSNTAAGTDWTRLLSDPQLVRHVGRLLQIYRESPPEMREAALLAAMREIKAEASGSNLNAPRSETHSASAAQLIPTPVSPTPPFEPDTDLFGPSPTDDRR